MSVGGSNIVVGTAGSSVANLNSTLKNVGTAIGAILIVIAIIKIIISLADENSGEKVKGSMMFGVGILFVSISGVLSALGVDQISSSSSANSVAANVLTVLGVMINYSGVGVIILGVIMNIMAIHSENSDEQAKAVKLLTTGIGLISAGGLCTYIKSLVSGGNQNSNAYINGAISWICSIMTYAGAGFVIVAIFKLVISIKSEDSREGDSAKRLFLVGIALLSLRGILSLMGIGG